jgi:hypothetical protein
MALLASEMLVPPPSARIEGISLLESSESILGVSTKKGSE